MSYNICVLILIDADALIKLHRAGILEHTSRVFDCIIAQEIYHEVLLKGREFNHSDADEIDKIIQSGIRIESSMIGETQDIAYAPGVDAGEKGLLGLFYSSSTEDEITIISDDPALLGGAAQPGDSCSDTG